MQIVRGNLWDYHKQGVVCITTNGNLKKNGELVMGAGIALQAKQRFPQLPKALGSAVQEFGNIVLYFPTIRIMSFPTKNDWWNPSDLNLIQKSCSQAVAEANHNGLEHVYLPRPGCKNGQLDWTIVGPAIASILDDRFAVVIP